jgi:predicted nucleic acid-binding protein
LSVYADSSFFVSLYLNDTHSREVQRRITKAPRLWLTPLHRVEWTHVIVQHVFLRKISVEEARQFYAAFEADRLRALWSEVPMPEMAFEISVQLAKRHGPRIGLGTLDTLHVASALELRAERFWTFDERQAKLARVVGLKVS